MRSENVQEHYRAVSTTHADTLQMNHLDSLATLTSQTTQASQTSPAAPNDQEAVVVDTDDQASSIEAEPPRKTINYLRRLPILSVISLICAGCALAIQSACNAELTRHGTRSFTSIFSFGTGLLLCIVFFLVDILIMKKPLPKLKAIKGGVLGAYYVILNILTVPRLGAATVLAIFVGSQVIMACIIDHFGLVGMKKRPFTIPRIIASLGLVGCVVVIAMF
ncbi:hypothetical protein CLU79DRAFT_839840 [Phycomyces nitens]|nr:hypothetical protein CLU79DRAFT_839840 [Phycomyces nitens]